MPELPEVETVRRMLESTVRGRTIRSVRTSGLALRSAAPRLAGLTGRTILGVRRRGKYLLLDLDGSLTLLSHLGMSGRWLFFPAGRRPQMPHVHARLAFADGSALWFQDVRRFGLLRAVPRAALDEDPSLAPLGADPVEEPPTAEKLRGLARGSRVPVKAFLLDQRRLAGIGNIYASEILHRAGMDPRRRAGSVRLAEWDAIARWIPTVLLEAIERSGTTFSAYRTVWGEPGGYGERLRVYDRAGEPCRRCGTPIRRIVQGQRSTFFCPECQRSGALRGRPRQAPATARAAPARTRRGPGRA